MEHASSLLTDKRVCKFCCLYVIATYVLMYLKLKKMHKKNNQERCECDVLRKDKFLALNYDSFMIDACMLNAIAFLCIRSKIFTIPN